MPYLGAICVLAKLIVAAGLLICLSACILFVVAPSSPSSDAGTEDLSMAAPATPPEDRYFANGGLTVWWDREQLPGQATMALTQLDHSNIHPQDYAGADACKKCHPKNYALWSEHPHRWMNALASEQTVKGNFAAAEISYLGGAAQFQQDADGYRMKFSRDGVHRVYRVTQTIGSRFFQYYVGRLHEGPEASDHPAYAIDHVLPFGYWLDRGEWVPAVHVGYDEAPDGKREDPFARHLPATPLSPYYQCNSCHTTFALGDELTRNFWALGRHTPFPLHWSMPDYVREAHPGLMPPQPPRAVGNLEVESLLIHMQQFEAPQHALNLGVSCEACHLGSQRHAEGDLTKPSFFPASPHLHAETDDIPTGREQQNVNWTCGRCHAGERPYYAAGMSTWNSTEYTDASKGGCYSQLTCIHCHNPHQATGPQWTRTAAEDDASCLQCHPQLAAPDLLTQHTHHAADSEGSRCMNCHMPRLNEGLQDVVRTHTIFSPTNREMIESNHLNACNICHVEETIDWTVQYLKSWYASDYSAAQLSANYPHRDQPAVVGWLKSSNEAVRLAATDAMARSQDTSALSQWIDVLNDPYLLNRQFARVSLEKRFDLRLEDLGYRYYMTPEERREPIERIRRRLMSMITE